MSQDGAAAEELHRLWTHDGTSPRPRSVGAARVFTSRVRGEQGGGDGGGARKQLDEQTVENICMMTYLFHVLSQL